MAVSAARSMTEPKSTQRRLLPLRARHALLTAHVIMSVGLLGDSAGFLAVAIRAATTDDPAVVIELVPGFEQCSVWCSAFR
jgi:hypothetical protein